MNTTPDPSGPGVPRRAIAPRAKPYYMQPPPEKAPANGLLKIAAVAIVAVAAAWWWRSADRRPASTAPVGPETTVVSPAPVSVSAAAATGQPHLAAYDRAKRAITGGNLQVAVQHLQEAIAHDAQFAEAWYQLGAAQTRLAIQAINNDESRSLELFSEGVRSKKRARALIGAGETRVWTPAQTAQASSDLQQGLQEIDNLLDDRPTLIAALKLWSSQL